MTGFTGPLRWNIQPAKYRTPAKADRERKKLIIKEVLPPEEFSIFVKLRDWRKETAAREAVPLYTIFMNDQLAAMVRKKITIKAELKEIEGIGDARIEKYGDAVLAILKQPYTHPDQEDDDC